MVVHNAFHIEPVLKKSALKITALDTWENRLLVGTDDGSLMILEEQSASHLTEFAVLDTRKGFTKRGVAQLQVCEELGSIISLTSDGIQVNRLNHTMDMTAQLIKTRGSHLFAMSADISPPVLCCASKKKLLLYRWESGTFNEWNEIVLADTPKCLTWCGDSICAGVGRRYQIIQPNTGSEKTLFDSNSAMPTAFRLPGKKEVLLGRDNLSVFQDFEGRPSRKYGVKWSDAPVSMVFSFPYLIAVLPKSVEVHLIETQNAVQTISLRANTITPSPRDDAAFVLANNQIYRLRPVPIHRQLDMLMEAKNFETAVRLCEMCGTSAQVAAKAGAIYKAHGLKLFMDKEFDQAMAILSQSNTLDPREIISMFPDLRPPGFPAPEGVLALQGHQLLRAQVSLIKYLNKLRRRKAGGHVGQWGETPEAWLQINTAQLRAMVRSEPENVMAFLQLEDSLCDRGIAEPLLIEYGMWHELVALYYAHGDHRSALTLLEEHGQGADESHPLHGVQPTIDYLQSLGGVQESIVFEFSRWVLRSRPAQAMSIFTGAAPPSPGPAKGMSIMHGRGGKPPEPLPIQAVLDHLKTFDEDNKDRGGAPSLRIDFLEHAVQQGMTEEKYHNELVLLYLDGVQKMKHALAAKQAGQTSGPITRYAAGSEPGALGMLRKKLLNFLSTSSSYSAKRMLAKLPMVDLYEERALILSKLGQHEQALMLYAHRLGDANMAVDYCERHYDALDDATRDVYLSLLKVYLKPPDSSAPMTMQALSLMSRYFERLDPAKALDVLPSNTSLRSLQPFFESAFRTNSETSKSLQISKALIKADHVQVLHDYHTRRNRSVQITSGRKCRVSGKKIGTSAFVVYPNNTVVLLGEKPLPNIDPVTGRDFSTAPWD